MGFVARGEVDLLGSSAADHLEAGDRGSTVQEGEHCVEARDDSKTCLGYLGSLKWDSYGMKDFDYQGGLNSYNGETTIHTCSLLIRFQRQGAALCKYWRG